LAALGYRGIVRRTAAIPVISILLLAACGAWGQEENPATGLPRSGLLPDAPAPNAPINAEKFHGFVEQIYSPPNLGAVSVNASAIIDKDTHLGSGMQPRFTVLYGTPVLRKQSSTFIDAVLYRSLLNRDLRYHASTSNSIVSRVSYAVSCDLITRNDSGRSILNTSYLLGVLTSAVVATADRPYWARSTSTTFNNFGSTIGSDAGMNFLHEFQPGIIQMLNSHSPKFVKRIEASITKDRTF
jgi:hypothetical protein